MKSRNIILTIAFFGLVMGPSCNKDLTEVPYSDLSADSYNYTDAYQAIGITYANMRSLFGHQTWYALQETSSDQLVMPANPSGWDDGGMYKRIHLHSWNSENSQMASAWNAMYRGVVNANRVISYLEDGTIPPPANTTAAALVAEMRVTRAFFYWLILDNFGTGPLIVPGATDLPTNATRQELYDFIVSEINASMGELSENNDQLMYGRFNKWGAKTLLANVYLNAEVYTGTPQWAACITQCDEIIASGKYSLEPNYKDIFKTENQRSTEIIFPVPFDENQGGGFFLEMYSWHGALKDKVNMQATPWGSGSIQGIPQFIDLYDAADKRIDDSWLRGPQVKLDGSPIVGSYDKNGVQLDFVNELPDGLFTGESEGYRMNKFEVKLSARSDLSNDFPFFRYAEVLMMKAECLLRTGSAPEAAILVSEVRRRDFADPAKATVTGAQLTANSKYNYGYIENYVIVDPGNTDPVAFGGMLDELGFEFVWEAKRRRDNIRFGVFTTKSWLSHKPNGAYRSVFPIPQTAINANPNLKQNEGY